jgi:hypothetical protein
MYSSHSSFQITIIKLKFNLIIGFVCNKNNYLEKRVLKMTEMQYILCEAETNGLIDLDTRNIMLEAYDVMVESTALQRNDKKYIDEINALVEERNAIVNKYESLLKDARTDTEKERINKMIKKKIAPFDKKIDELSNVRAKNYKAGTDNNWASPYASKKNASKTYPDSGQSNKEMIRDKFYSKGKDPYDKKPGRYLLSKESADDLRISIYESELNGEITVEEREELIEALNEKLNTFEE